MISCPNPSCRKALPALSRTCSFCQADLTLLVDYVDEVQDALRRAHALTRSGHLAEAVWSYLEILEVDPDNTEARGQVGQVAAAVRHFDRAAESHRAGGKPLFPNEERRFPGWLKSVVVIVLIAAALGLGYALGLQAG